MEIKGKTKSMYNQDGTVTQDMRRKEEKYRYGKDMKKKKKKKKKIDRKKIQKVYTVQAIINLEKKE